MIPYEQWKDEWSRLVVVVGVRHLVTLKDTLPPYLFRRYLVQYCPDLSTRVKIVVDVNLSSDLLKMLFGTSKKL